MGNNLTIEEKTIAKIVKVILKSCQLNDAASSGVGSFVVYMLVTCYIRNYVALNNNLANKDKLQILNNVILNDENKYAVYMLGFLNYFANANISQQYFYCSDQNTF